METITKDLSKFGAREKDEARELLSKYGTNDDVTKYLGDGVEVWFNLYSGYVFLCDEEYNTAMIDDNGKLNDFLTCPNCGKEGFKYEILNDCPNGCCREYIEER